MSCSHASYRAFFCFRHMTARTNTDSAGKTDSADSTDSNDIYLTLCKRKPRKIISLPDANRLICQRKVRKGAACHTKIRISAEKH